VTGRVVQTRRIAQLVAAIVATTLVVVTQGAAQSDKKGPGNLFKSMPQKRDEPIRISSATLEVRDKSKVAMFKGDVVVIQGDTNVRCNELVVFYEGERGAPGSKATPAPAAKGVPAPGQGGQQIRRMEARGSVVVTQKDQRAIGDRAEFDMRTNTVTLIGNVVITSADNVVRGERVAIDLNSGVARMGVESGGSGRVEMLVNPKSAPPKPGKQN
jgi:lipopolysaccharide export system protein LptA